VVQAFLPGISACVVLTSVRLVAQRGFARNTNVEDRRFLRVCPWQGRRQKPIVCPTAALNHYDDEMTRSITTLLLALFLAACGHFSAVHEAKEQGKRYPMQGDIKALDANTKTAVIDAGKIGDWMDAMTMPYLVKPDKEFQKLHVGDHIQATVVVNDPDYYVTDVKVTPKQ